MGKEAQAMWELFKEENPDTILKLDHTGAETNAIFVHSPQTNGHDEHTDSLGAWIKSNHPKSKVGVGVMKYDNWQPMLKEVEATEIVINPEILNAPKLEQEKEESNDSGRAKD